MIVPGHGSTKFLMNFPIFVIFEKAWMILVEQDFPKSRTFYEISELRARCFNIPQRFRIEMFQDRDKNIFFYGQHSPKWSLLFLHIDCFRSADSTTLEFFWHFDPYCHSLGIAMRFSLEQILKTVHPETCCEKIEQAPRCSPDGQLGRLCDFILRFAKKVL